MDGNGQVSPDDSLYLRIAVSRNQIKLYVSSRSARLRLRLRLRPRFPVFFYVGIGDGDAANATNMFVLS